jgi:nitrite reductase/ring-hydroxylating ferredoxin subunit
MAMPADESVSSSLKLAAPLEENAICSAIFAIDGENMPIILHRREGRVLAWLNVCPHQGRRLDYAPGRFLRDGDQLICAAHGACFSLANGECVSGPCRGSSLRQVLPAEDGTLTLAPVLT